MDEPEKMAQMNAWLDEVCEALGVHRADLAAVTPAVLGLVSQVAHGPSRPAGPLTAMAVGIAASRADGDFVPAVEDAIGKLQPLLAPYRDNAK
ncbi:hypothetical protein GCM10009785_09640 [Brooklawnia cerclae]|uniref:DUF6457 domain-containing protein n=1 Tax=Brooklawnia cerclae TaxID=349934 RepID=A0ABX0SI82_9ACTN|nr:hypothetical protein [Brooklawnia cerclae]